MDQSVFCLKIGTPSLIVELMQTSLETASRRMEKPRQRIGSNDHQLQRRTYFEFGRHPNPIRLDGLFLRRPVQKYQLEHSWILAQNPKHGHQFRPHRIPLRTITLQPFPPKVQIPNGPLIHNDSIYMLKLKPLIQ